MSELSSPENYKLTSKITPIAIFILMLFGGYVKAIGAGLACPDWPLCYGQVIPLSFGNEIPLWVALEFIHRVIALFVTLLLVILAYQAFKNKNEMIGQEPIGEKRFLLILFVLGLLFFQISLGGLTIISSLNEFIVTTHLGVATAIFGLSILHYTWIKPRYVQANP